MKSIIIAIDGHSSCGKSTIAKSLAKELGYTYIDTGAMYRAVAFYSIKEGFIKDGVLDEQALINNLDSIEIRFDADNNTLLNGENVEDEIRGVEVSRKVTMISQVSEVRKKLIAEQRAMGKNRAIVMDGRDIGTVVFPDAELKLYVTADIEIRAQRRYDQMKKSGKKITFEEVKENLMSRDHDDIHKGEQPLKKAEDAVEIDTSFLNLNEQFQLAIDHVRKLI